MKKVNINANQRTRKFTKEAIKEALFIVLSENKKELDSIKIVDLVNLAGVARSSFYRNYNTVEEVLKDSLNDNICELLNSFTDDLSINWLEVVNHFKNYQYYYLTLYNSNCFYLVLDCFNEQAKSDNYYFLGWNGFIYNILVNWIKNGMKMILNYIIL